MIDFLFGPHRSWQRRACIGLAGVLVVLGIAIMVVEDVVDGLGVVLVGVVSGAVLARVAEDRVSRAAARELLGDIRRMPSPSVDPRGASGPDPDRDPDA